MSATGGANHNLTFVISGTSLPIEDKGKKGDSFVQVFSCVCGQDGKIIGSTELGTTEIISNDENPQFNKVFRIFWTQGTNQKLKFRVKESIPMAVDDVVGEGILDLDDYVRSYKQNYQLKLCGDDEELHRGYLRIKESHPISFRLGCRNVPKLDLTSESDPYCLVYWRRGAIGADIPLGVTEVLKDNPNPDWSTVFEFGHYQKGTGQFWFFRAFDKDTLKKDDFIGELLVDVDAFVADRKKKLMMMDKSEASLVVEPIDFEV